MEFAFIKGLGLGLLLAISVGPILFTIIKLSIRFGHKAGYAFISGVSLSDVILAVLGNAAAELVRSALKYETFIAIGGAALLIGMGVYSLFFRKDPVMDSNEIITDFSGKLIAKYSLQGFFMNMLNPGPIFFWLTASSAFAYLPLNERILLFGTALVFLLITDILKVNLAGRIRNWLTPNTIHKISMLSALILIVFGLAIGAGIIYTKFK